MALDAATSARARPRRAGDRGRVRRGGCALAAAVPTPAPPTRTSTPQLASSWRRAIDDQKHHQQDEQSTDRNDPEVYLKIPEPEDLLNSLSIDCLRRAACRFMTKNSETLQSSNRNPFGTIPSHTAQQWRGAPEERLLTASKVVRAVLAVTYLSMFAAGSASAAGNGSVSGLITDSSGA